MLNQQYDKVIDTTKKVQEIAPQETHSYFLMAMANIRLGKTDETIRDFQKALEIDPTLESAHMGIAVLKEIQGDLAKSREHYQKALKLNPDFAPAANSLNGFQGMSYWLDGKSRNLSFLIV